MEVYLPDGTPAEDAKYEIQMIKEANLWLIQYIARKCNWEIILLKISACTVGSGWANYQQTCILLGANTLGWYDASSYCHNLNPPAALADVTTQDKDDFIHCKE